MNKWIMLLVCAFTFSNCKDDNNSNNDFFSPVQVYISINLNLPSAAPLTLPQGFIYETGGNKGVIVYHTIYNDYVAFDRTCPHLPANGCSYVSMDSSSTFYACGQYNPNWTQCCGSKFDPGTGIANVGPANRPLKQYNVKQDGNTLIITNTP